MLNLQIQMVTAWNRLLAKDELNCMSGRYFIPGNVRKSYEDLVRAYTIICSSFSLPDLSPGDYTRTDLFQLVYTGSSARDL
jgi:hypothetical protein